MGLNDKNGPYSDSDLDPDFRDDSNPGTLGDICMYLEEIRKNTEVSYYSENKFDLILEGGNENSPTAEEMEEYFSQNIKEKYNGTYIRDESNYKYRMKLPFDNFLSEVSKETFQKHRNIQKQSREEERKKREERNNHNERIKNVGFQKTRSHTDTDSSGYEKRLLDVLENNNIPNIPAISSHTTDITKLNKNPDFYEQILLERLEKSEKEVETTYIIEEVIIELAKIFSSGHIDNPDLFLRFEKLKRNNLINLQRRIFRFGLKDGEVYSHFKTNDTGKESEHLEDKEVEIISYFFKYWDFGFDTVRINKEEFTEKLKKGFIAERIRTRIQGGRFGTKYNGFYNKNLERVFDITQEQQNQRYAEAKKKFMVQYPSLVEIQTFDNISVLIRLISDNWNNILKRTESFSDLKFDEKTEKDKITFGLENCIRQGIEKIKNKEIIKKVKRENRKNLSYKKQLHELIDQIEELYIELKKIDPDRDDSQRQKEKEKYKDEYINFHRNNFIENKIVSILKVDINNEEALKEQIIGDVTNYFEKKCKKEIGKKITHPITYNHLANRKIISFITQSFSRTGHAILLKTKYPNDKERKLLRQELIQKITKNLLEKTEKTLTESDFSEIDYFMIEPLTYLYKRYDGKENNLIKNPGLIKENYISFLKTELGNDINSSLEETLKELEKPTTREQIKTSYINTSSFSSFLSKYLSLFLKEYSTELGGKRSYELIKNDFHQIPFMQKNIEHNEINNHKYTEEYMKKLALFGYDIQDIEKLLDKDIQENFIYMFQEVEKINFKICSKVVEQRLKENGQSGGKLQRIVQEAIIKEFGTTVIGGEQIDYLIDYLSEYLESIFFRDLEIEIIPDFNPFRHNKDILQSIIREVLQNFKQRISLSQGNNMKSLGF